MRIIDVQPRRLDIELGAEIEDALMDLRQGFERAFLHVTMIFHQLVEAIVGRPAPRRISILHFSQVIDRFGPYRVVTKHGLDSFDS